MFFIFCRLCIYTHSSLGTPPCSRKWLAPTESESRACGLLYKRHPVTARLNIRIGKTSDLRDFERGMFVSARRAGSSISETVGLLGFSHATVSMVYQECCDKQKTFSQQPSCRQKQLIDDGGRWRMARIVQDNRQIMAQYNSDLQNGISEHTTRWSLSWMGYCSRRPHWVPLLSVKNKKKRLQWAHDHDYWTIEEWKSISWSDKSQFLLHHADGRVRIWCKQHESMDPTCLVSTVQAGGCGILVWVL